LGCLSRAAAPRKKAVDLRKRAGLYHGVQLSSTTHGAGPARSRLGQDSRVSLPFLTDGRPSSQRSPSRSGARKLRSRHDEGAPPEGSGRSRACASIGASRSSRRDPTGRREDGKTGRRKEASLRFRPGMSFRWGGLDWAARSSQGSSTGRRQDGEGARRLRFTLGREMVERFAHDESRRGACRTSETHRAAHPSRAMLKRGAESGSM